MGRKSLSREKRTLANQQKTQTLLLSQTQESSQRMIKMMPTAGEVVEMLYPKVKEEAEAEEAEEELPSAEEKLPSAEEKLPSAEAELPSAKTLERTMPNRILLLLEEKEAKEE